LDRRKTAAALVAAGLLGHAFFLSVSIAGMQIALAVAAAGLLLVPPPSLRTPLTAPIVTFVAIAAISDLISPFGPPPLAFATLWRSAIGFFVVCLGLRTLPEKWPGRLLLAAAAGLAIASVVGLVQYRTGIDLVHVLGLRPARSLPGRRRRPQPSRQGSASVPWRLRSIVPLTWPWGPRPRSSPCAGAGVSHCSRSASPRWPC
jgi:hypothetical protein